jgi:hypothetical protein
MKPKDIIRLVISLAVIGLFGFAYLHQPSNELLLGALISTFTTAVNWWLGSSQSSSDKTSQMDILAHEGVRINNPPGNPVKVEEVR